MMGRVIVTGEEYLRLLGQGLAIARGKRDLTQEAAAALLDIHVVSLSQYERGIHQPRPAVLLKMIEVYQLPVSELFALAFGEPQREPGEVVRPEMSVPQVVEALGAFLQRTRPDLRDAILGPVQEMLEGIEVAAGREGQKAAMTRELRGAQP